MMLRFKTYEYWEISELLDFDENLHVPNSVVFTNSKIFSLLQNYELFSEQNTRRV